MSKEYGSIQQGGVPEQGHQLGFTPPFILFDPNRPYLRWTVLFFACFLTFGSYFCYDNPAALQSQMEDRFNVGSTGYSGLYSAYSWPNTVQVFFGGWLIDRFFGLPLGAFIFCGLVFLGQLIFAAGITIGDTPGFVVAIIGRFVFGLGGETLSVAQASYTAKWFRGKELALAFSITLSFSRIGSAINLVSESWIVRYTNLPIGIWFGGVLCLFSLTIAVVLGLLSKRGDKAIAEDPHLQRIKDEQCTEEARVSLIDVRFFPLTLWIIFAICVTFYVSVFVWIQIAAKYIEDYWGYSDTTATFFVSLPYLISSGVSPIVGFIVDKLGGAPFWITGACSVLTLCHLSLVLYPFNHFVPFPALILQGIAYSTLAASLWPSVPLLVEQRITGTAFGLMTALQNAGLAIAPLVIGVVIKKKGDKLGVYFLAGCAAIALMLSVLLIFVDLANGAILIRKKPKLQQLPIEGTPIFVAAQVVEEKQLVD